MGGSARPFVVVVTGSECTGKTTLAAELAAEFDASWSPEFARSYVDAKRAPLDASDVEPIAAGQLAVDAGARRRRARRGRLVVRDTDLVSTTVYARHYYGSCPAWIEAAARRRAGDLYLLLCPDVPWMPDGLKRDRPGDGERAEMHQRFRVALASAGARVIEIGGSWIDRRRQAFAAVAAAFTETGQPTAIRGRGRLAGPCRTSRFGAARHDCSETDGGWAGFPRRCAAARTRALAQGGCRDPETDSERGRFPGARRRRGR